LDALERIARSKEQPPSVKRPKMENGVEFYDQEVEEDDDVLIVETRRSSIEEGEIMDEEEEMKIERTNVTVRRKRVSTLKNDSET
jgi:phosphosulfolactate synthase (CoM biosynthesis protein A)